MLFMFIVGAELRAPDGVRAQVKAAGWVGVLGVLLPMGAGLAIAPVLYPLAPGRRGVLAVRAVHGGGDVDHRVPGDGAHPQGSRH